MNEAKVICKNVSLHDIVMGFNRGKYKIPLWARDNVWSKVKKKAYKDAIYNCRRDSLPSYFVVYGLKQKPKQKYVMDGIQRLSCLIEIFDKMVSSKGKCSAERLFKSIGVNMMFMICDTEKSAMLMRSLMGHGTAICKSDLSRCCG
jgi:hypothetical protein